MLLGWAKSVQCLGEFSVGSSSLKSQRSAAKAKWVVVRAAFVPGSHRSKYASG
jgi:hypothetical protein